MTALSTQEHAVASHAAVGSSNSITAVGPSKEGTVLSKIKKKNNEEKVKHLTL